VVAPKDTIASVKLTITGLLGKSKEAGSAAPATLVVDLIDSNAAVTAAADLIFRFRPDHRSIYLVARGSFTPPSKFIGEIHGHTVENDIVKPAERADLGAVLSKWHAELVIAYYCADDEEASRILSASRERAPKWWQISRSDSNEDYMQLLSLTNPVAIYSQTRSSLELIGNVKSITEGFNLVREYL
jgi:hypothetical protein